MEPNTFLLQRVAANGRLEERYVTLTNNSLVGIDGAGNPILLANALNGSKLAEAVMPDRTLEVQVTVANQTARFALTTTAVQAGDRVKQTDDGTIWTLSDEANIGNANGWLKTSALTWSEVLNKPTDFDTEIQNLTVAHGSITTIAISKKVTVLNVTVGTLSSHYATIRLTGGTGGERVFINKTNVDSTGGNHGTCGVDVKSGSGTFYFTVFTIPGVNGVPVPSTLCLVRKLDPCASFQWSRISQTDSSGFLTNIASKTVQFNMVPRFNLMRIDLHATIPASMRLGSLNVSGPVSNRSTLALYYNDGNGFYSWGTYIFQFIDVGESVDNDTDGNPMIAVESDNSSASAQFAVLQSVLNAMSPPFTVSMEYGHYAEPFLVFTANDITGNEYSSFPDITTNMMPDGVTPGTTAEISRFSNSAERLPSFPYDTVTDWGGILLFVRAQAGSGGGADVTFTAETNDSAPIKLVELTSLGPDEFRQAELFSGALAAIEDRTFGQGGSGLSTFHFFTSGTVTSGRTTIEIAWLTYENMSTTIQF